MSEGITLDYETRSAADIKAVGSYLYSLHPSTEELVLSWQYGAGEVLTWHPAFPAAELEERGAYELRDLHDRVRLGEIVEAHNVFFERAIWTNISARRRGWPALDPRQLRCSAAKASYYGLPRALDKAGLALRLAVVKDESGKRKVERMWKPRKPLLAELKRVGLKKGDHELFALLYGYLWHQGRADFDRLIEYNRQDVRAEFALSSALPPLPAAEIEVWLMDQRINWDGVRVDVRGVRRAVELANAFRARATARIREVSHYRPAEGGSPACGAPDYRKRIPFQKWIQSRGVELPNTQAKTIEEAVKRTDLPADVGEALRLWSSANRASVAKYDSILERVASDERVRDILRYCGAGHTGRWAGMGIQVHNFVKGKFNSNEKVEEAWRDIATLSLEELVAKRGDPMVFLSHALRGALIPSEGNHFLVADFSAIEARLTFWLAGQDDALATIRAGKCIYKEMAGVIYEIRSDPQALARDSQERDIGKRTILGSGFGMGPEKFVATCLKEGGLVVPLELGERSIKAYRDRYPLVPKLWKGLEENAIAAVENPSQRFQYGRVIYGRRGPFLHCRLPSGRLLSYAWPSVKPRRTPWGQIVKGLEFYGVDSKTKQWVRHQTWGGTLTENCAQAVARDMMAEAMLRCERHGYPTAITVHDEGVADTPKNHGSLKEFEILMSEVPVWAPGFPMSAEGWAGPRYHK